MFYVIKVYTTSIGAACQLDWPKDRLLIQVLDDSDDEILQMMIRSEVSSWKEKGVNIIYRHRFIRTGYKAGNLKSAMSCDYVKDYEFVAIFDADFQPNPDFLKLTVPHFKVTIDINDTCTNLNDQVNKPSDVLESTLVSVWWDLLRTLTSALSHLSLKKTNVSSLGGYQESIPIFRLLFVLNLGKARIGSCPSSVVICKQGREFAYEAPEH